MYLARARAHTRAQIHRHISKTSVASGIAWPRVRGTWLRLVPLDSRRQKSRSAARLLFHVFQRISTRSDHRASHFRWWGIRDPQTPAPALSSFMLLGIGSASRERARRGNDVCDFMLSNRGSR